MNLTLRTVTMMWRNSLKNMVKKEVGESMTFEISPNAPVLTDPTANSRMLADSEYLSALLLLV